MSLAIPTTRGRQCAICRENFRPGDQRFTHVGGERHNGFHRRCLATWVAKTPTCPFDRQPIDPNSLLTRTQRMMARLGPALASGAYAVCFGIAAAGVSTRVVGVEGAAAGKKIALGVTAVGAGLLGGGGGGEGAAILVPAVVTTAAITGIAIVSAVTGVEVAELAKFAAKLPPLGAILAAAAGGSGINWMLNRRGVDPIARENIGAGMFVGGIATISAIAAGILPIPLTIVAVSLVGGVAAGIFSFIRT